MGTQRQGCRPMDSTELKERTVRFAVRILKPADVSKQSLWSNGCQPDCAERLLRSGKLPIGASQKSRTDFIHKITIVLEKADETGFWIGLIERAARLPPKRLVALRLEAEELIKIFNATRTTAKS